MGKRQGYEPGIFCWVDLATTDPAGAKTFYGELFGWEAADMPMGETGTYTMLRLGGDEVCALYELEAERREQGIPSHWFSYVSVEDAEATAARAQELGGAAFGGAFDVMEAGRMAIISDPAGAAFAAWQPGNHIGAGRVNDIGCLGWNELQTRDTETATVFYSGLFGWETEPMQQDGEVVYTTIRTKGWPNGGVMPMAEQHPDTPSFWLPYFIVESCEGAANKVQELGGGVLAGPMEVGAAAKIAVLTDPQGAAFAVFEGETDD